MNTSRSVAAMVAAALTPAAPAAAHHSLAAFDGTRIVKLEGTISEFRWVNPHASFVVAAGATASGGSSWRVEMNAPNVLMAEGWRRDSLKIGDQVTVYVNPPRPAGDAARKALYVGVILPSGEALGEVSESGAP